MKTTKQQPERNPLLEPPVDDPTYVDRPDGVVNHDYYIYGGLRKYAREKSGWVPLSPVE